MAPTHRPLIGFSMKQKKQLPINNKGAMKNKNDVFYSMCWYVILKEFSVYFLLPFLRVISLCCSSVEAVVLPSRPALREPVGFIFTQFQASPYRAPALMSQSLLQVCHLDSAAALVP